MTEIRKRATTAVVTLDLRIGGTLCRLWPERVTPLQVVRSGWVNDTNTLRDDVRVIAQVAICRAVRRIRNTRSSINITPHPDGTWEGWFESGCWEMVDGEVCMAEVRRLL